MTVQDRKCVSIVSLIDKYPYLSLSAQPVVRTASAVCRPPSVVPAVDASITAPCYAARAVDAVRCQVVHVGAGMVSYPTGHEDRKTNALVFLNLTVNEI